MLDKYLKTTDQAELYSVLDTLGMFTEGNLITANHDYAIDEVGVITESVVDSNNEVVSVTTLPGYHCNIRFMRDMTETEATALDAISIPTPNSPNRVWF